jgi:hypothetical protein
VRGLALAVLVLAAAAPAHADNEWYGWQIMLADGLATTLVLSQQKGPAIAGLVTYALAGPVIHAAHGDFVQGGIDLGARLVLPAAGTVVALATDPCRMEEYCDAAPLATLLIFFGGFASATILDWAVLSVHETPALRPSLAPTHGGAVFSLSGRF